MCRAVLLANPERITPCSGPGCEPQGKGDCIAPVCKAKGYACDNDHEQCCHYPRRSPLDWYVSADDVYMKTKMQQVFLTDEMVVRRHDTAGTHGLLPQTNVTALSR